MTPPPSPDMPLPQRLLALAQTLQYAWFVGHLTLLLSTLRYGLSYIFLRWYSPWALVSYRVAFLSAAATYGIVVYKAYRARIRSRQANSPLVLATDENAQYLAMALVWLFSRQIPLALLPFAVYSVFHVATYTRTNLIPVFQPPPPKPRAPSGGAAAAASTTADGKSSSTRPTSALADALGKFVKEYYDASMGIVALLEIFTWFRLVISLLTFSRGAIFLMVAYTAFLRARYAQSGFLQAMVQQLTARADAVLNNQSVPPQARQAWHTIKNVVRQATDATDLSRFVQQGGQRPKKAQ